MRKWKIADTSFNLLTQALMLTSKFRKQLLLSKLVIISWKSVKCIYRFQFFPCKLWPSGWGVKLQILGKTPQVHLIIIRGWTKNNLPLVHFIWPPLQLGTKEYWKKKLQYCTRNGFISKNIYKSIFFICSLNNDSSFRANRF